MLILDYLADLIDESFLMGKKNTFRNSYSSFSVTQSKKNDEIHE